MYMLSHDPSVCVFMYGQATESRWVKSPLVLKYMWIPFEQGVVGPEQ